MTYREFTSTKQKCQACEMFRFGGGAIPSGGNTKNPTLMVVGEAPGREESLFQTPFIGKAGKLLKKTLAENGLMANTIFTNLMPCRPVGNKFPDDEEAVKKCVEMHLLEEIKIVKPKVILLVGAKPLHYILGLDGITETRGEWKETDGGIPTMATFHPSYLARNVDPQNMVDFEGDVKKVVEKLEEVSKKKDKPKEPETPPEEPAATEPEAPVEESVEPTAEEPAAEPESTEEPDAEQTEDESKEETD